MRIIDADAVGAAMAPRRLVEALRLGHRAGVVCPVERLLLAGAAAGEAALTWAAWDPERGIAVKTATVFPANAATGRLPNVQSVVVLFDGGTGRPMAVLHGESFTRMKTAATSALAADILARAEVETLAVLGAGAQAETHVRFHLAVRPSIRRIRVWNRTPAGAERLAAALSAAGLQVEAVAEPEAAVRGAGIVTCLTAAATPVLAGLWLSPGAHVDLVGSYTPEMRESDDDVVRRGRLFADSLRFGVMACGDFAVPIAAGTIPADRIEGDLYGLCSGRVVGRGSHHEITVCKNGGGGHLDLMAARAFYDDGTPDAPAVGEARHA